MSRKRDRGHETDDTRMVLDDTVMTSLKMGCVFTEPFKARINSIDFHRQEPFLVTASDDDCIQLFEANEAKHLKSVSSRKFGCRCVTYTHHRNCILVASSKGNSHAIRYLSLHDNRWLRYFEGHTDRVRIISMSPCDDTFLSAADDQEVRMWDLRTTNCQAMVKSPGLPCCAFDQQGLVFAISSCCGVIKLFDVRGYDKGPFATFANKEENCSVVPYSTIKFSYDGQKIVAVNEGCVYIIEAFEGRVLAKFRSGTPSGGIPLEAGFTPCGKYVLSSCYDRKIRIWNIETIQNQELIDPEPKEVIALEGHSGVASCVKWAPQTASMASACSSLAFWIPDLAKEDPSDGSECKKQKAQDSEDAS